MLSDDEIAYALGFANAKELREFVVWRTCFLDSVREATAADRPARAEPVAFMREGWGPDCGPFVEFYTADQMGSRDRDGWTALYTAPPAPPAPPAASVVSEYDRNAYEELRSIIDGGSESMTHADAVEWCKRHADADWMQGKTADPVVPVGWKLVPVEPTAAMREDIWAAMLNAATPDICKR